MAVEQMSLERHIVVVVVLVAAVVAVDVAAVVAGLPATAAVAAAVVVVVANPSGPVAAPLGIVVEIVSEVDHTCSDSYL